MDNEDDNYDYDYYNPHSIDIQHLLTTDLKEAIKVMNELLKIYPKLTLNLGAELNHGSRYSFFNDVSADLICQFDLNGERV